MFFGQKSIEALLVDGINGITTSGKSDDEIVVIGLVIVYEP